MFLRNTKLAAVLMAAGISPVLAQHSSPIMDMDADGEVQIAPDGHVSDYLLKSKLSKPLTVLIDRAVRSWLFEPILIDGKPVIAKTAMHLRLEGVPTSGDNYAVKIVGINFGEPKRTGNNEPPGYPMDAAYAHLGAKVVLSLRLDETGKVIAIEPYQTSLTARANTEREAEHWRKIFERTSIAAAKNWRYDLTQTVAGKPIGTNAIVPVVFSVGRTKEPGKWTAYVPGPVHPPSWMPPSGWKKDRDLSLLADGEATSMDSRFRLKNDVIGKAL